MLIWWRIFVTTNTFKISSLRHFVHSTNSCIWYIVFILLRIFILYLSECAHSLAHTWPSFLIDTHGTFLIFYYKKLSLPWCEHNFTAIWKFLFRWDELEFYIFLFKKKWTTQCRNHVYKLDIGYCSISNVFTTFPFAFWR